MELLFREELILAALILVPLERWFALDPNRRVLREGLWVDLAHMFITAAVIGMGILLIVAGVAPYVTQLVPVPWQAGIASQPLALQFLEITLLADLGFYAVHRAFHAIPVLWRFHAIHHSITEMDWVAAHRVHPVDQTLTKGLSIVPAYSLGFDVSAIAAFAAVYHWQSLLIHSNVRLVIGPLRWLLVSPQFHHWHHANHPESRNRNFSGQLPLWDLVFGTFYLPGRDMPERYGTDEPVARSYAGQLSAPFLPQRYQSWRTLMPAAGHDQ